MSTLLGQGQINKGRVCKCGPGQLQVPVGPQLAGSVAALTLRV